MQEYPHLSAAEMQDWLLERFRDFVVGESTMRLYVNQLREEYQIEKQGKLESMKLWLNNLWVNKRKWIGVKQDTKLKIKKK